MPRRFSIELDALYRRDRTNTHYPLQFVQTLNPYLASLDEKSRTWDVPLLLKYRLTGGPVRPFVTGGALWSRRTTENWAIYTCLGPAGSCRPPEFEADLRGGLFRSTRNRFGPAAGSGIEIKTRFLTISPEVRWSHLQPSVNQVTAVVGLTLGR